jgi:hypothetical protein
VLNNKFWHCAHVPFIVELNPNLKYRGGDAKSAGGIKRIWSPSCRLEAVVKVEMRIVIWIWERPHYSQVVNLAMCHLLIVCEVLGFCSWRYFFWSAWLFSERRPLLTTTHFRPPHNHLFHQIQTLYPRNHRLPPPSTASVTSVSSCPSLITPPPATPTITLSPLSHAPLSSLAAASFRPNPKMLHPRPEPWV